LHPESERERGELWEDKKKTYTVYVLSFILKI
jgi:hypothetical protein